MLVKVPLPPIDAQSVSHQRTNDVTINDDQHLLTHHSRATELIGCIAGRCSFTVYRWNSTRLHIWPACAFPAAAGAVGVAMAMWMVAQCGTDCMTSCNSRLDIGSVLDRLVAAVRKERLAMLSCSQAAATKNGSNDVYLMQRATDSTLDDVTRQMADSNVNNVITTMKTRLNFTRRQCHNNDDDRDQTDTFRECWLGFSDVVMMLVMLLWSPETRAIPLRLTTDCKRFIELLNEHDDLLMANELSTVGNWSTGTECLMSDTVDSQTTSDKSDRLELARSVYNTWSSNRSLSLGLLSVILLLLCAVSPLLCLIYSRTCSTLVTSINEYLATLDSQANELVNDTRRIEGLLCQLLPPSIAQDLKTNKSVLAESYKLVTIYFSDIVGFTTISATSTPMQVVEFLNKLYTEFDARIDLYDVYKVETIGDAYMIVSGCPRTNGIRHAGELAMLSLDLLNMTHNFKIPHKPEQKLMLRIGLHSGPCLAAVVGDKMPRYCLFGETVSIASRMESTGQALRVQISEDCKILLDQLGVYIYDDRGQVEIKESEFVKTYWLTGKDGYRFKVDKDVCVYIPKKVKLERVVVMKVEKPTEM